VVGLWVTTFSHGLQTSLLAGLGLVATFGLLLLFGYQSLGRHFHRHRPWDRFR
jgi:hypothetical protein